MEEEQNVISRSSGSPIRSSGSRSPERAVEAPPLPPSSSSSSSELVLKSTDRRGKYLTSFAIYFCTLIYACGFNFLAPCVIEFSRKFETEVSQVSLVFSVTTSSYLVGALLSGISINFLNRVALVVCLFTLPPVVLFLFPRVATITEFYLLGGFLGFFGGGWDAVQIAWIIDIWRTEAPPFILAQHFSYSLGTNLPPLILGPFLNDDQLTVNTSLTSSYIPGRFLEAELEVLEENLGSPFNSISDPNSTSTPTSKLYIPFSIAAGLATGAFLIQLVLFFCTFNFKKLCPGQQSEVRSTGDLAPLLDEDNNEAEEEARRSSRSVEQNQEAERTALTPLQELANKKPRRILLIFLSCCCIASYSGLELCTMQFLPTFAVYSKVAFTEAQGAHLLFSCTIAYCVCRALGILLVLKIPPYVILCGNINLLFASNLILLTLAENSGTWLWVGTVMLGCAMSTTYPAYYAFIEKYIFVTNGFSTTVTVSAGLVSAIYPVIVGGSVKENPNIMIYVNFVSIAILTTAFSITFWVTWVKNYRERKNANLTDSAGANEDNKTD